MKKIRILVLLIMVFALAVCCFGMSACGRRASDNPWSYENYVSEDNDTVESENLDSEDENEAQEWDADDDEQHENTEEDASSDGAEEAEESAGEDMLIPHSDTAGITGEDLEGFDDMAVRLARDEIYARHGFVFEDPEVQDYFDGTDWYVPDPEVNEENPPVLSEIEADNIGVIRDYESFIRIGEQERVIVRFIQSVEQEELQFVEESINLKEVEGGFLVTCDIERIITIDYEAFNKLKSGEVVNGLEMIDESEADISAFQSPHERKHIFIYDNDYEFSDYYYLTETPTLDKPADLYSIWLADPVSGFVIQNTFFFADNMLVRILDYEDNDPYDEITFEEYIEYPQVMYDFRYYAVIEGGNIVELEEIYEP